MAFNSLASYLEALRAKGDVVRADACACAASDELAALADLCRMRGAPIVLFAGDGDKAAPVAANPWATHRRLKTACAGRSAEDLAELLAEAALSNEGRGERAGWFAQPLSGFRSSLGGLFAPKQVKTAECQQIVRLGGDVDLRTLPMAVMPPGEDGSPSRWRFLAAVEAHFHDPVLKRANVAEAWVWREVDDALSNRLFLACCATSPLRRLLKAGGTGDDRPEIAFALGGDPAGYIAAMAPTPFEIDRLQLAGFLRSAAREMVRAKTLHLDVPADADMVLECRLGPVSLTSDETDGFRVPTPCGLIGPSLHAVACGTLTVEAITHRANPVMPLLVPGEYPNDWTVIRRFMARAFLPAVASLIPEVTAVEFPESGMARHKAVIAMRKEYGMQARRVAEAFWSMPTGRFVKELVLVDEGIDVAEPSVVAREVMRRADFRHDVWFSQGPCDWEDPVADWGQPTTRVAIDATTKRPGDMHGKGHGWRISEDLRRRVLERWNELGVSDDGG